MPGLRRIKRRRYSRPPTSREARAVSPQRRGGTVKTRHQAGGLTWWMQWELGLFLVSSCLGGESLFFVSLRLCGEANQGVIDFLALRTASIHSGGAPPSVADFRNVGPSM